MIRVAAAAFVAVLLAVSLAEAQRGWRGGYGRWGGEAGVPPRYATPADQDGRFHFCRLQYTAVRAQQRGDFMIIPTAPERWRWRLKRWLPEVYFREMLKFAAKLQQRASALARGA